MSVRFLSVLAACCVVFVDDVPASDNVLPEVTVYSPRIANQASTATFAMPVSALRFEPRVDLHSRNFAEGQADVTIRGGIFENTGFTLGANSLFDPQTGHYFAEIPVAPMMLGAPEILTGADLALQSINATSGAIAYSWRPIQNVGVGSFGAGEFGLILAELYQGIVLKKFQGSERRLSADFAWAYSEADGSMQYGDHDFDRINARLQFVSGDAQTDLFAGYQEKFFGWPNMYTPFNSKETEDIQTLLFSLNHRRELGPGDFVEIGAYHRRNEDDYAFNRFLPVGPVHPFQHTTWVTGAAAGGRVSVAETAFNFRMEVLADELESTSLNFGRYHTRSITKLSFAPERSWRLHDGAVVRIKGGATYDDTNRGHGSLSPVVELSREVAASAIQRMYASYAQTTQVPTYTALNSNAAAGLFRGNPNLGRAKSRNLEAGVKVKWSGWTGQAAIFHRRDDDLVDWTFKRGVTARTANPVEVATTGFEMVATRSWTFCDVVVGYTWLSKEADYGTASVDASFYALNHARHRLTVAIIARLTPRLEVRFDNQLRAQAENLLRTAGGDDALLSALGMTYRPAGFNSVSLTVQADNLWDSDFQDVPAVPAPRRQLSARIGYAW